MKKYRTGAFVVALALGALTTAACAQQQGPASSPTATFKAFFAAAKSKDVDGIKKALSKGSLEVMEGMAKEENMPLDEALKASISKPTAATAVPETRNEKIDGDTATLEIKNEKTNKWDPLPFVKEDGQWKIAFDKAMRDVMQKFSEQSPSSGMPPPPAAPGVKKP